MKNIRYFLEGALLTILFLFFRALPPKAASNIGGWIGRTIGHRLATSRKARRHISMAMPETAQREQDIIIRGMWDNLGRVIAEYPHLERIGKECTVIENKDVISEIIKDDRPIIFIGAHLGNWEISGATFLAQLGHSVDLTYREPNNPWTAKLLDKTRTINGKIKAFPKARQSAKLMMQTLKSGESLGILIDQKYNEGIEADFFNMPAMTNPVFVRLAQKYNCHLVPIRCERINGCNFRITAYPDIDLLDKDGNKRAILDIINEANSILEGWIKQRPEQWTWLHRRWKK